MRIVLFVLLLNSVCGDSDDGCLGGWFEFTCNYRNENNFHVTGPRNRPIKIQNIEDNTWTAVDKQRSVYRNTTGKYWRVFVTQHTSKDFGEYKCTHGQKRKIDLEDDDPVCPQHSQIAYIGADTTIRCTRRGVNFICKQSSHSCDILSRAIKPVYRISDVSRQDQGVYWCGYESQGYKVSSEKIDLQVVEVTKRSLSPGQDLTHQCNYTNVSIKKFVCKGESYTMCEELVSTSHRSNGRFTLKDAKTDWMIILTIRHVTIEDRGSYWCGTERTGNEKVFFHKLELTVAEMTTPPSTTHPDVTKPSPHTENTSGPANFTSPTQTPTPTPNRTLNQTQTQTPLPQAQDELRKTLVIVIPLCVAVLLLALIGFCIHRRLSSFRKTAQTLKVEHCYEEIQEHHQQTGSGTALQTIYAMATAPGSSGNKQLSDGTFKENVLYNSQ